MDLSLGLQLQGTALRLSTRSLNGGSRGSSLASSRAGSFGDCAAPPPSHALSHVALKPRAGANRFDGNKVLDCSALQATGFSGAVRGTSKSGATSAAVPNTANQSAPWTTSTSHTPAAYHPARKGHGELARQKSEAHQAYSPSPLLSRKPQKASDFAATVITSSAKAAAATLPSPPLSPVLNNGEPQAREEAMPADFQEPRQDEESSTPTSTRKQTGPRPYYDHKHLKKQTCRRNSERWDMENIIIRRLRYLVDHLDEFGDQHLPLLNALETSGIQEAQLHQYFPFVNSVAELRLHLTNILAGRDPTSLRPHATLARNITTKGHRRFPKAAADVRPPPVAPSAQRQQHGHNTPIQTPSAVLDIVEHFHPVDGAAEKQVPLARIAALARKLYNERVDAGLSVPDLTMTSQIS